MDNPSLATQIERGMASLLFGCFLGLVIAFMPIETLPVALILGVPFYACMERVLTRKVGWLPFGPVRILMAAIVVVAATRVPGTLDRTRLDTLPSTTVTLDQAGEFVGMPITLSEEARIESVHLPSRRPTIREFIEAVESQTERKVGIVQSCTTSPSIISDGYPVSLIIE